MNGSDFENYSGNIEPSWTGHTPLYVACQPTNHEMAHMPMGPCVDLLDPLVPIGNAIDYVNQVDAVNYDPSLETPDPSYTRKHAMDMDSLQEPTIQRCRKTRHKSPPSEKTTVKFACPYFQHDPTKFTRRQACSGPGFSSISRVKEHIYRAHRQPEFQCIRCYQAFDSRDSLEDHQRAEVPCDKTTNNSTDLISTAQFVKLRRKPSGEKTDVERWGDIYSIIFPKASVIPSCYYEFPDAVSTSKVCSEGMKHVEKTLVASVQRDLVDGLDQVEEKVKARIIYLVTQRLQATIKEFLDKCEEPTSGVSPLLTPPPDTQSEYDAEPIFGFEDFAPLNGPPGSKELGFASDAISLGLVTVDGCLDFHSQ